MPLRSIAPLVVATLTVIGAGGGPALAGTPAYTEAGARLSGPHIHRGLAVYLIHGPSSEGMVPLTSGEALAAGTLKIVEETRESDGMVYTEVRTPGGVWVHKTYLAN